jgi:hypothetical protein
VSNVKFDTESQYFSGQGVLLLGVLHPVTFAFLGFEEAGNVSDVSIDVSTSNIEHKGSQDGQRAMDLRLSTSVNAKLAFTMESWKPNNIARALRGTANRIAAAASVAFSSSVAPGLIMSLGKIRVSAVVANYNAVAMTDYTAPGVAWDYKVNADAGSIKINDGSVEPIATIGLTPTACTIGATTTITVGNTWVAGERVTFAGFSGADAALINGKTFNVVVASPTAPTINLVSTGKTITTAAGSRALSLDQPITVSGTFSHDEHFRMDALSKVLKSVPVRFEGLNTADGGNPVIVDVWKFSSDPLKKFELISDTLGAMATEGTVLADNTKVVGSKYFQVTKLNS